MLYTTFSKLKEWEACKRGYDTLAESLGGDTTYGMDTLIPLTKVLESNGISDTLWCFRTLKEANKHSALVSCMFAENVLPIFESYNTEDKRPRTAIEVTRKFFKGEATIEQVRDAAADAAYAAYAAADAADAAYAAADAAAADAARAAAAARAARAARAAYAAAADAAAADAARAADAAYAARAADAAYAAADADADAAYAAAYADVGKRQKEQLRLYIEQETDSDVEENPPHGQ